MSSIGAEEREWQTRRRRIDGRLEGRDWSVVPADSPRKLTPEAITEYETANGPADYALSVDGRILGVVETKRLTIESLQKPHAAHYREALVDIISMVKHAADDKQPLLTAEEHVDRAIGQIALGQELPDDQQAWLDRIRSHLIKNLSIDREDFGDLPVFSREGGWSRANQIFRGQLVGLIQRLNGALAA